MNKEQNTPQKETGINHGRADAEFEGLKTLKEYMIPVAVGVIIALVVVIGFGVYRANKQANIGQAANDFMQAKSVDDIQKVAKDYKDTPTGPSATLALANAYLQNGQYLMAKSVFSQFAKDYPEHPLVPSAVLGEAYCVEAEGNVEGALVAFEAFVKDYPEYFMVPQAVFSQGRCLEELGRYDDAVVIYENFMVENPESRWTRNAETAILYVEKAKRAKAKGLDVVRKPVSFEPIAVPAPQFAPAVQPVVESQPVEVSVEPMVDVEVVEESAEQVEESAVAEPVVAEEIAVVVEEAPAAPDAAADDSGATAGE